LRIQLNTFRKNMPLFLKERNKAITELMDSPDCDVEKLHNTYRNFSIINRGLSGWRQIFYRHILPLCDDRSKTYSLLDIGFGGGDIPLLLHELASKNGVTLEILGIETDERALHYVGEKSFPKNITFRNCISTVLIEEGKTFDFVICNHVLHHLTAEEVYVLSEEAIQLCTKRCIFNDLRRSGIAYILFWFLTLIPFRNSFIRYDGLISIRRSYTPFEFSLLLSGGWRVKRLFAFRILAIYEKVSA